MDIDRIEDSARAAARLLKALSNPQRLLVLCHLTQGEKSVGQLEAHMNIAQPRLSQQLARLRRDGLVQTRRDSRTIYYALGDPRAKALIGHLYDLFCAAPPAAAVAGKVDVNFDRPSDEEEVPVRLGDSGRDRVETC